MVRTFVVKNKEGVWKYWLDFYEDGKPFISAIKRLV